MCSGRVTMNNPGRTMKRAGVVSFLALALAASLSGAAPTRAKAHGLPFSGRIASLDAAKKTFLVAGAGGRTMTLVWTDATKVSGGDLKTGEEVTLRYLDKDGKHIATSIRIGPPTPPTPVVAATPNR